MVSAAAITMSDMMTFASGSTCHTTLEPAAMFGGGACQQYGNPIVTLGRVGLRPSLRPPDSWGQAVGIALHCDWWACRQFNDEITSSGAAGRRAIKQKKPARNAAGGRASNLAAKAVGRHARQECAQHGAQQQHGHNLQGRAREQKKKCYLGLWLRLGRAGAYLHRGESLRAPGGAPALAGTRRAKSAW